MMAGNTLILDRGAREQVIFDPGNKLFMPTAYHGTSHTFSAEPGAPFGRFRTSAIGTGEGAQAYGHGLYFAGKREVAEHYRKMVGINDDVGARIKVDGKEMPTKYAELFKVIKDPYERDAVRHLQKHNLDFDSALNFYKTNKSEEVKSKKAINDLRGRVELIENRGSLYKVELAPKENEYLLWDKPLSEQPKGVREKLAKTRKIEKRVLGAGVNKKEAILNVDDKFTKGGDAYKELATALTREKGQQDIRKTGGSAMGEQDALASQFLKEAGIPGIKYLDGSSRSKGEGDYNYVIFDEADVAITEKLFMPASEAGAGKGKVAEAAKLWQEKGTDSPYFKKWFGKSKVVDENGEPLVVYHGTKGRFNEFERSRGGEFGSGMYFSENIDSAKMFGGFQAGDSEVVTMPAYLTLKNPLITSDRNIPRGAGVKSLIKKGYDGVIGTTPNGQKQYIAFFPEQIKSATGNRGTFDAGERNINYMPSDRKAPTRQPANRITRQAPAMPGNRFMAPAASAGAKLSERFR
jgi:hypothetical protein